MAQWVAAVNPLGIGTGTTATQLDGQLTGSASDVIVPSGAKGLLAVRPYQICVTPTAHEAMVATVRLASNDIAIGDYEILAPPVGSGLGTNVTTFVYQSKWYPANFKVYSGQHIQVYGQAQTANTAAPFVGCDLLWSSDAPAKPQAHFKWNSVYAGNTPTSTGTSSATVTGASITINTGQKVFALYGEAVNTTPTAVKPIYGYFYFNATGIKAPSAQTQTVVCAATQGFLGTTTTGDLEQVSAAEGLDIAFESPTTFNTALKLTAITAAGSFMQGVGYF